MPGKGRTTNKDRTWTPVTSCLQTAAMEAGAAPRAPLACYRHVPQELCAAPGARRDTGCARTAHERDQVLQVAGVAHGALHALVRQRARQHHLRSAIERMRAGGSPGRHFGRNISTAAPAAQPQQARPLARACRLPRLRRM